MSISPMASANGRIVGSGFVFAAVAACALALIIGIPSAAPVAADRLDLPAGRYVFTVDGQATVVVNYTSIERWSKQIEGDDSDARWSAFIDGREYFADAEGSFVSSAAFPSGERLTPQWPYMSPRLLQHLRDGTLEATAPAVRAEVSDEFLSAGAGPVPETLVYGTVESMERFDLVAFEPDGQVDPQTEVDEFVAEGYELVDSDALPQPWERIDQLP